ncbi:hypothetical protein SNE40_016861 [Patella caerulea]|uniref:Uncharacterized protein n=1 Tax=Patella caerulea TaxID=87958 RepID=A0AAN8JDW0_PATCE
MVLIIRNSFGCYSRISQCIKSHSNQTICVRYCTRVKRPVLLVDEDRYNGVTANLQQVDINTVKTEDFSAQLADSL